MDKDVGRLRWLSIILLVLVTYAVYQGSLSGPFLWDDGDLILKDSQVHSLKNIPHFFGLSYWKDESPFPGANFRPLRTTSFAIDYFFWEYNPYGYHLTNLLFHIFNVLLVYFFVRLLLYQPLAISHQPLASNTSPLNRLPACPLIPLLSALLFATHPIHTEAVCWIKNRSELFCTFFFLSSLILFIKSQLLALSPQPPASNHQQSKYYPLSTIYYTLSLVCFVLALLSKETAITLPAVLVFYVFFFLLPNNLSLLGKGKRIILKTLPFWIVGILYVFFRFKIIAIVSSAGEGFRPPVLGLYSHILSVIKSIGYYLQLIFFPVYLCAERLLNIPKSLFEVEVLLSLGVIILLLAIGAKLFKRLKDVSFALFLIFIILLPVVNIYFLYSRPIAEQRLYLPSVGFCILLALLFAKTLKRDNAITQKTSQRNLRLFGPLAVFSVLAFYSVVTVRRIADWRNPVVFWEKTVKSSPKSTRAYINLSITYDDAGRTEEAIQALKKSIEMDPKWGMAYFDLGIFYDKQGRTDEATVMFEKGINLSLGKSSLRRYLKLAHAEMQNYTLDDTEFLWGYFYQWRGLSEKAITHYQKALEINSGDVKTHYHLAEIYASRNHYEQAIFHYLQVVKIDPNYPEIFKVYLNLGNIYHSQGKPEQAIIQWEKSVEVKPGLLEVRKKLADVYKEKELYPQAIECYKKVLEIEPKNWDAYFNLGNIYTKKGLYKEASEHYKKAVEYNPNFAQAHYNLGLLYLRFGQFNDAAKKFEKVLYLEPKDIMAKKMYQFALESVKEGRIPQEFQHP
jgi:tetratricopeptide (TPR) repeat protein